MAHSTHLYVMRHLPTSGNLKKQYIGWTDESIVKADITPLSEVGILVHTSDLCRTIETAELFFPNAEIVAHEALRELHFGDWEQQTYAALCDDSYYRAWLDDPFAVTPPGGESFESFQARIVTLIYTLLGTSPGPHILVVHGGVIRLLKSLWTDAAFMESHASHDRVTHFTLRKEENWLCTSYSEVPITESAPLFATLSNETD